MNMACALFGMWCAVTTPISPVQMIHPDKKWFLCTHAQEGEITVQVPSKEACIDIISIDGRGPLKTTIVNGNEKIDADNSRGWWCEEFVPQN